jgi:hypothetical protein
MKNSLAPLAWLASALLLATPSFAKSDKDCDRPSPPKIPDGQTASAVDMIGATQRTKLYITSAETFLACLQEAEDTVTDTGRDVKIRRIEKKREEVVKQRDETVARFNEQVRIYKIRTGQATEDEAPGETPQATPPAGSPPPASQPAPDPKPR